MSFTIFRSPGVYYREIDLSTRVEMIASTIAGIVFASKRGTMRRKLITSRQEFIDNYGKPDPTISFGHDESLAYLTEGSALHVQRVVNGAEHAGLFVLNDVEGEDAAKSYTAGFVGEQVLDYNSGSREVFHLQLDGNLITGNIIAVTINGQAVTTTYATSHPNTMSAFRTAINNRLDAVRAGGEVTLLPSAANVADRVIRIVAPYNTDIILASPSVTSGASQAVLTIEDNVKLFEVFAENPGAWGNNVGIKIRDIDQGTPHRVRMSFSEALVTGNSFSAVVNGTTVGPIAWSTSNDATMALIATAIQTALGAGSVAAVIPGAGSTADDDRDISIVAPNSKEDITIVNAAVTGGASQANVAVIPTLTRIPSANTFVIEVYTSDNVNLPVERFTVSLKDQLDGYGFQQNIEEVINNATARSKYIRIKQNKLNDEGELKSTFTDIQWLTGGDDGLAVTDGQIIQAWENSFGDPEEITVRLAINGGYTNPAVQQKIVSLCESRHDCFAILDFPSNRQQFEDASLYRKTELNINSSYGAIYSPDLRVLDVYKDQKRFIPPAGHVAAAYARTDRQRATWFAPAGFKTGKVYNVLELRQAYRQAHREVLHDAQINPIIQRGNKGFVIFNDITLQAHASALSHISIRRLEILIMVTYANALEENLFDPHDEFTAFTIRQSGNQLLQPIKEGRGLYKYLVTTDNDDNDKAAGLLNVQTYLDPTIPVGRILHESIITRTGANFNELIQNFNGNF